MDRHPTRLLGDAGRQDRTQQQLFETHTAETAPLSSALHSGVRLSVLARLLGQVLLLQAAFSVVPMVFCYFSGDHSIANSLLTDCFLSSIVGTLLRRIPKAEYVQKNEVLCVAGLSFLLTSVVMSMSIHAAGIPWIDSFFEAVSAVTTTGLSTVADVHDKGVGFLFLRSWIQWYGGLGIATFAVALSLNPQLMANRITSGAAIEDDAIGGTQPHYRRIVSVYAALTLGGAILIIICGGGLFQSVCLSLSAVSTGGFSPVKGSLANLPYAVSAATLLISLAAALPLVYYHLGTRGRWKSVYEEPQWKVMAIILLLIVPILSLVMQVANADPLIAYWRSATMAVTAQTGAGFSTMDTSTLAPSGKILLIVSMFIGGAAGSTTGGTKLLRWLIIFKVVFSTVDRALASKHTVVAAKIGDSLITGDEVKEAGTIVFAFASTIMVAWFAFTWIGHDPLDSLFEVVSATCTVGISSGICSPDLASSHKLILCVAMLLGRVEIIAWLVILWPPTWLTRRRDWKLSRDDHAAANPD